ncbi:hypothetical protein [Marinobacter sp. V034]|uniref:hypothetical protein n=1 Tax=Marinobacter sp. V034 TaxID=3459610 RepID=UPI0040444E77
MKKLFLSLVGLLLLGYVAFKGAAWYQVNQTLTQLQESVAREGVLKWGGIGSSIAGQVSVYDIEYQHFSVTQPLKINRVTFIADSPSSLISMLTGGPLPQVWEADVENARMAMDTNLMRDWVASEDGIQQSGLLKVPCGTGELGLSQLMALGVDQVAADLKLSRSASDGSEGGLALEVNGGKLGSLDLRLPDHGLTEGLSEEGLEAYSGQVLFTLRDGGFMRRVAAFCAREADTDVNVWAGKAAADFAQRLAKLGYKPSDQLLALYKVWMRDGGELKATLTAGDPLYGLPRRGVSAPEIGADPQLDNFDVFYNGARVPDLFVREIEKPNPVLTSGSQSQMQADKSPTQQRFRISDAEEASRWVGRDVRVTLSSGRVVEGRLSGTDDRRLNLTRIVDGGEVAYPLPVTAITLFEVWRRQGDRGIEPPAPEAPAATPENEANTRSAGDEAGMDENVNAEGQPATGAESATTGPDASPEQSQVPDDTSVRRTPVQEPDRLLDPAGNDDELAPAEQPVQDAPSTGPNNVNGELEN